MNYKIGDRFQQNGFLGWIYIINLSSTTIYLKKEHVSCSDYYEDVSVEDFRFRLAISEYHTFVRI